MLKHHDYQSDKAFLADLRRWYAGQALAGAVLTDPEEWAKPVMQSIAAYAFGIADAMLAHEANEKPATLGEQIGLAASRADLLAACKEARTLLAQGFRHSALGRLDCAIAHAEGRQP